MTPQGITRDAHYAQPDEAFNSTPEPLAGGFAFVTSHPPPDPSFKEPGGQFLKGFDPRRHEFTREGCSRGCWAATNVSGAGMGQKLHAAGRWPGYEPHQEGTFR